MARVAQTKGVVKVPDAVGQYETLARSLSSQAQEGAAHRAVEALMAENKGLSAQLEQTLRDDYEIAEYLRGQILLRDEQLVELHAHLAKVVADAEAERQAAAQREEDLRRTEAGARATLAREHAELREQLTVLAEVKAKRLAAEEEIIALRQTIRKKDSELAAQMVETERRVGEAARAARAEAEARAEEALKWGADAAGLDAGGRRLLAQNKGMAAELALHVAETEALQADMHALAAEAAALRRDLESKADMEAQYARRGSLQARRLKEEAARVDALQRALATVLADFKRETAAHQAAHAADKAEAQADIAALRQLARARGRELRRLQALLQDLARGRTDVETFLVTSLHMVQAEIGLSRRQQLALTNGEDVPEGADDSATALMTADIRGMSWRERERVLKLLFAQLSQQRVHVQPPQQRHSLPALQQGIHAEQVDAEQSNSESESDDEEANAAPLHGVRNSAGPAQLV